MTAAEFPDYRLVDADGQPLPRVFGHEQEYGFNFAAREHAEDSQFTHRLLLWMDMDLPQFTGDGARQYIDHDHPEYSTAEETSFLDGAYRYLHGHIATINRYRDYVRGRGPRVIDHDLHPDFIRLFANTCNQTTSWGKHKSLQVSRGLPAAAFIRPLAAYRASRIVWSGAGSVGTDEAGRYRYELSEKAPFIEDVANPETTRYRPLVNLRDQTLGDEMRYRRIHDAAGESVFSPFALALDVAAESIIFRALEVGVDFSDLWLLDPVSAIKAISADPSLKQSVELADGRRLTGLQLQRELGERALKGAVEQDYLTYEEREWGERWLNLLEDMMVDPQRAIRYVNWLKKQQCIEDRMGNLKPGESELSAAWKRSLLFHMIHPRDGWGMQLLRQGYFADSPTADVLKDGLPLPDNRAKVRVEILRRLREERIEPFHAHWEIINTGIVTKLLLEPLVADLSVVEPFVNEAARRFRRATQVYDPFNSRVI